MAVAGINPVGYTNDKVMGPGEESNTNIVTNELLSVDLPQGIPLFTDEQVRKILMKFVDRCKALNGQFHYPSIDEFMEDS